MLNPFLPVMHTRDGLQKSEGPSESAGQVPPAGQYVANQVCALPVCGKATSKPAVCDMRQSIFSGKATSVPILTMCPYSFFRHFFAHFQECSGVCFRVNFAKH